MRIKNSDKVRGVAKIADIVYNEQSGGNKVTGPIMGQLTFRQQMSGASEAFPQGKGSIVAFYNDGIATVWILTDTAAIAAIPSIANAIALKPQDYTIMTFDNDQRFIRCSSANVAMYIIEDDSEIR